MSVCLLTSSQCLDFWKNNYLIAFYGVTLLGEKVDSIARRILGGIMVVAGSVGIFATAGAAYIVESIRYWWHKVKPLALVGEGIDEKYGRKLRVMPLAVQQYVMCFLTPQDLGRLAQTCRRSRAVAESEPVWRFIAREKIILNPKVASLTIKDLNLADAKEADAKRVSAAQAPKNLYKEKVKKQHFQDVQLVRDFNKIYGLHLKCIRSSIALDERNFKQSKEETVRKLDKSQLENRLFVVLDSQDSVNTKANQLQRIFILSILYDTKMITARFSDAIMILGRYENENVPISVAIVDLLSRYNTASVPMDICLHDEGCLKTIREGLWKDIHDSQKKS